jgi:beta-lactamase superfamily II metal-dependent hydrolase
MLLPLPFLLGQGNGKLQLHFVDVGQGDGAILISPGGQVVAFDIGQDMVSRNCDKPVSYYDQLGLPKLDYLFISHYHQDHIGCVPAVLAIVPVDHVEDRGKSYTSDFYTSYVQAVGTKRHALKTEDRITLDDGLATPVSVEIFSVNANGKHTSNENDLSLAARITYGNFHVEIGGDLSGDNTENYIDVESGVATNVGKLDVYKVHHHCSSHSSNDTWLETTRPTVAIISAGNGNTYGHPTPDCLERLHAVGTRTYWTETGNGAEPVAGSDIVGGTAIVTVDAAANQYTVAYGAKVDTYAIGGGLISNGRGTTPASFAWSKKSKIYHVSTCDWVKTINHENLMTGPTPPEGKTLHADCPTHR